MLTACTPVETPPTLEELYGVWAVTSAAGPEGVIEFTSDRVSFAKDDCLGAGSWALIRGVFASSTWAREGSCWGVDRHGETWLSATTSVQQTDTGWNFLTETGDVSARLEPSSEIVRQSDLLVSLRVPQTAAQSSVEPVPLPDDFRAGPADGHWALGGLAPSQGTLVIEGTRVRVDVYRDPRGDTICTDWSGRWLELGGGGVLTTPAPPTWPDGDPELDAMCPELQLSNAVQRTRIAGFDGSTLVLLDARGKELGRLTTVPPLPVLG